MEIITTSELTHNGRRALLKTFQSTLQLEELDVDKEIALAQKFGPPGRKKGKRLLAAMSALLILVVGLVIGFKAYFAFTPVKAAYSNPDIRTYMKQNGQRLETLGLQPQKDVGKLHPAKR